MIAWQIKAQVVDPIMDYIVLGMPFLKENEAVINIKNSNIIFDDHIISYMSNVEETFRMNSVSWITEKDRLNMLSETQYDEKS